jgi:hypothetical protein
LQSGEATRCPIGRAKPKEAAHRDVDYKTKFAAFAEVTDRRERNVPLLAIANKELDLLFCSAEQVVLRWGKLTKRAISQNSILSTSNTELQRLRATTRECAWTTRSLISCIYAMGARPRCC